MSRLCLYTERHAVDSIGGLRSAVLGANEAPQDWQTLAIMQVQRQVGSGQGRALHVPARMEWGAGFPTPLHHQRPVPGLGDGPDRAVVLSGSQHSCIGSCFFHWADAPARSGGKPCGSVKT